MYTVQLASRWLADLKQIMAVDVLTGKSKLLVADNTICTPPKIEDESIGM